MIVAIIVSKKDKAALNIYENLKKFNFPENAKIHLIDEFSVYAENIDKKIDADLFIFATKHQSESGIPSLSVHSPGNWGKADYGGKDKKFCMAPANFLKKGIQLLEENNIEGFEVIQECTHHGPFMEKPVIFIEIGSTEKEWARGDAGEAIAKTIKEIITSKTSKHKTAVGIGGPHHTPNFKNIILNSEYAIGHVCPKYNLQNLDKEMIMQAIEKTVPKAELVILDWKGLGEHKQRIVKILEEIGVEWRKIKEIRLHHDARGHPSSPRRY